MTTVFACAKTGVMVADSKCSDGDTWFPVNKVTQVGKELVGFAGDLKHCKAWLAWYQKGKKGPRPKLENFEAIALREDGVYSISSDGLELLIERGYHGIGSGGSCAVAAYMAGADAQKAVEIACAIDNGSGGEVKTYQRKA